VTFAKAISLLFVFRGESIGAAWQVRRVRIEPSYFGVALPFFLLGFSGMLQSRIDLYSVSLYLPAEAVGHYQLFINLMIYLQAVANFILTPFVKGLYRLDHDAIHRISLRLLAIGIVLVPVALLGVNWLLPSLYAIELTPSYLLLGGLFALPVYFYLPTIYALYKADRQQSVLWVNLSGAALNLLLNLLFIPRMGALGALLATTLVQWFMLAAYLYLQGRRREQHLASMLP
jgi:O-antigen/teichoic acid export membrane protein